MSRGNGKTRPHHAWSTFFVLYKIRETLACISHNYRYHGSPNKKRKELMECKIYELNKFWEEVVSKESNDNKLLLYLRGEIPIPIASKIRLIDAIKKLAPSKRKNNLMKIANPKKIKQRAA